ILRYLTDLPLWQIKLRPVPLPRCGRIFAEQLMIVAGKPAEILESELHRDIRDRPDVLWCAQCGVGGTQPAVAKEGDRAGPERLVKRAMQRTSRHVEVAANLGKMNGVGGPGGPILL